MFTRSFIHLLQRPRHIRRKCFIHRKTITCIHVCKVLWMQVTKLHITLENGHRSEHKHDSKFFNSRKKHVKEDVLL